MDLKEKVLKAIEQCLDGPEERDSCVSCPYVDGVESYICDTEQLLRDVRELIKRQEDEE